MAQNKHLYLKNEAGKNDKFKKTRGFKPAIDEDQEEISKVASEPHRTRLRVSYARFYRDQKTRVEKKVILSEAIELVRIQVCRNYFLKDMAYSFPHSKILIKRYCLKFKI